MVRARSLSAERRLPTLEPDRRRRCPAPHTPRTRARAGARSLHGVSHAADGREGGGQRALTSARWASRFRPQAKRRADRQLKQRGTKYPFCRLYLVPGGFRRAVVKARLPGTCRSYRDAARMTWERILVDGADPMDSKHREVVAKTRA